MKVTSFAQLVLLTGALASDQLFLVDDASQQNVKAWDDWRKNIDLNKQPVIGILSQTLADDPMYKGYNSYIMSAYVKYME